MALTRRWTVPPEPNGEVRLDDLLQRGTDALTVLHMCGGGLQVVVDRAMKRDPYTGEEIPGEMVTTFAAIEWVSRTDTKPNLEAPAVPVAVPNGDEASELEPEPVE